MIDKLIAFVREMYGSTGPIPLHEPVFRGHEAKYVSGTIDSTFVSSVGVFVDRFEQEMAAYVGCPRAVAVVNGTAALHVSLLLAGVRPGDLVITQPLTFVATCNAISYCGAEPVFVDVDRHTLGLSPSALEAWLQEHAFVDDDGTCRVSSDGKAVRACVPMHTFGHPVDIEGLVRVCSEWGVALVEDAAESLGSTYKGRHTGTFGLLGALSFNGNKILTTGGGGMILGGDALGRKAKHLTTTAKVAHPYEYVHDMIGYNYRMPNINAALGCAQLEQLHQFLASKRALAASYEQFLKGTALQFIREPEDCRSNYWLNAVLCEDREHRDELLVRTNRDGVMTRPVWTLMNKLEMYATCRRGEVPNSKWLEDRVVNLPSSANCIVSQ